MSIVFGQEVHLIGQSVGYGRCEGCMVMQEARFRKTSRRADMDSVPG